MQIATLSDAESIVLDTETTGINAETDRIVEVAAIRFNPQTGEMFDHYHQYINPRRPVPEESRKVHGLTDEFLATQPTFDEVAEQILEFVQGRNVVIHNAPFDTRMLDAELKRVKRGKLKDTGCNVVDSLEMSRRAVRAKRHTLDVLCDRYGVDRSVRELHGALVDCTLLARVFPKLRAAYEQVTSTLSDLLSEPLHAPPSADINQCATRLFELRRLRALLEEAETSLEEHIRAAADGKPLAGEGWRAEFTATKRVDWKKVTELHLAAVDLKPFTKEGLSMSIKQTD